MDGGCSNDEDFFDKENMDLDERFKFFIGGGEMNIDERYYLKFLENSLLVKNIGKVV